MSVRLVVALFVLTALAGCVGEPNEPSGPVDEIVVDDSAAARAPVRLDDLDEAVPLRAVAPEWSIGQWFQWEVVVDFEPPTTVTTVVAADADDRYQLAFTELAPGLHVQWHHVVPQGFVSKADGSWLAHGVPFGSMPYPVEDGDTWTGDLWFLEGLMMSATATDIQSPDGQEAGFRIEAYSPDGMLEYATTWSPRLGTNTWVGLYFGGPEPWITATLLDAGDGHAGAVHFMDAVWTGWHRGWIPAPEQISPEHPPPVPVGSYEIPDGATHMTFSCSIGGGPGAYQLTISSPHGHDGTCEEQFTGSENFAFSIHSMTTMGGTHDARSVIVGQGWASAEIIALAAEELVVTPNV